MNEVTPLAGLIEVDLGAETREQKARRLVDQAALRIGRDTVNHLKTMYPAALAAVTKNAERSLTNFVRNRVNSLMRPVIALLINMMEEIEEGTVDADT